MQAQYDALKLLCDVLEEWRGIAADKAAGLLTEDEGGTAPTLDVASVEGVALACLCSTFVPVRWAALEALERVRSLSLQLAVEHSEAAAIWQAGEPGV